MIYERSLLKTHFLMKSILIETLSRVFRKIYNVTVTQDNDSGFRFYGFPAGTRRKIVVSGGKTPEHDRKVEAVIM
jgi:hypothetical protein